MAIAPLKLKLNHAVRSAKLLFDEISKKELLKATSIPILKNLIRKNRLRWAGRIEGVGRWPKKLPFGKIQ